MSILLKEREPDAVALDLEKAIAEADKGVFVSHEAVEAWVMSMGTDKELPRPKADVFKNV